MSRQIFCIIISSVLLFLLAYLVYKRRENKDSFTNFKLKNENNAYMYVLIFVLIIVNIVFLNIQINDFEN
jgi:uncharacterized membrane protein YidH (DUF202 family)